MIGAVFRGWNDVVKVLIEAGANPYQANNDGKTAFDIAQSKGPPAPVPPARK